MRGVKFMKNQHCDRKPARLWQSLFVGLVVVLLAGTTAWAADKTNKLTSVAMDASATQPTVLIQTAEPVGYRYTVYDSFDPDRVVIDFPGMLSQGLAEVTPVNQAAIKELRVTNFTLSSGSLSRVEILLANKAEYQVSLDGKQFRVAFAGEMQPPKPAAAVPATAAVTTEKPAAAPVAAAAQHANLLRGITLSKGRALIESNGDIEKFQHFVLANPSRLVVDLYSVVPDFKQRSFAVADDVFDQIRVGTYSDKTRLVFDGAKGALPDHLVEKSGKDLLVTWSGAPAAAAATPPAAAPAVAAATIPAPAVESTTRPVAAAPVKAAVTGGPVSVEAVDFANEFGRSVINVALSGPAKVTKPVEDGSLVRFEIVDATISRSLRRTIDASAFPSAVIAVTPYTVTEGKRQNVRIAVDLKGPVAYSLEQDGSNVKLVIDDGAYAEALPPAVVQRAVTAPQPSLQPAAPAASTQKSFSSASTADQMSAEAKRYTGEKITLVFDSANLRSILQLIGDVSGLNILASSDVQGDITLRLVDVPWDQALDLVLQTANLGKIQQGNVLRIMPKDKIREIEQASMKDQIVAIEEGVLESMVFPISYASVDDMKGYLTDIKSERGSIIADSRNKQLIVRDVTEVLEQMRVMIGQIDKPERQVMIEARIVEANTNFSRELGVKWNFGYEDSPQNGKGLEAVTAGLGGSFSIPLTNPASAGLGTAIAIGALDGDLNIDLRLSALESAGEGKIVSTPRITTLNGEKAIISQGTKIPFSTVSDTGTDVKFENAELKLEVTPEINPDGSIILDIKASNSAVGTIVPTATGNAVSIDEKKAETKVLVRDGQTTVIGGIFVEDERDAHIGVPLLKDVPVLGHLFKSTNKTRDRRELLIFITPRIVSP